ncbi:hypothetical protein FX988_04361 (plasmid) [Paraglaciecola mesophila]|uniref:Plasmid replication protein RepA n=1 Tax=Paraglaciecola mesophila TaxID=197222 RepID=A0A857JPV1_9ALTE|nr:hypothetical protein [Paraglaciecola mesophila]QHJ14079.1 hypothetical protein FX988_04361 [Paraglaciecola mesophila]
MLPDYVNQELTQDEIVELEERQMDLFMLVDEPDNCDDGLQRFSNTIGDIDLIPRFIRGRNPAIKGSQISADHNLIVSNPYSVGNNKLICDIHPATITRKEDGKIVSYLAYPGDKEEVVEQVLFMIAANGGLTKKALPGSSPRYGVYFTLYQIREILKEIGKTKPYDVIREALIILRDSKTRVRVDREGKEIAITSDVFADAVLETTGAGRAKDRCFISFSDYVVEQLFELNYSQFSFDRTLSHKGTLARFLHKYLCCNWRNAFTGGNYKLIVNDVMAQFGKSQLSIEEKRRNMRGALSLLVESGHITSVPSSADNTYIITATSKLAQEIKLSMYKKSGLKKLSSKLVTGEITALPQARRFSVEA